MNEVQQFYNSWRAADEDLNEAVHGGNIEEIRAASEKLEELHKSMTPTQDDN